MKGFSVCLDYGHGGSDPGAVYKGRKESMDNLRLGSMVANNLRQKGVYVKEIRNSDIFISLKDRAKIENERDYDFFISFHRNVFKPELGRGIEIYVYPTASKEAEGLGLSILKSLTGLGFRNRGLKRKAFYLLKRTKAPALLLEIGFIDNSEDNLLFDKKLNNICENISQEILNKAR